MMKMLSATMFVCLCSFAVASAQEASINRYEAINKHRQIYDNSCIPSGIEMILKLNKKVSPDFYNYQKIWGNKTDGTFANFDSLLLNGIRFYHKFNIIRSNSFPIDELFKAIEQELDGKRHVLIALPSGMGWHIFVVCNKLPNGEFVAYSKIGSQNLVVSNVKEIIRQARGTDIMTYRVE